MKLEKWQIILAIGATLGSGAFFLERHWNQADAVAHLAMKATSNKKQILEMELQRICEKYNQNWPCTTNRMSDQDKARYEQYQRWHEEERRRLDKQMGG